MAGRSEPVRGAALSLGLALSLVSIPAAADLNPYPPPRAQNPPLAPGSAADPQESTEEASPTRPEVRPPLGAQGAPLAAGKKRAIPRYHADTSHDQPSPWLWIPRIALSPLYLTSEYVVRRPLSAAATFAEEHRWPQKIYDFLTWDERRAGIAPAFAVDWGFRVNGGFYLFWNDLFQRGNRFDLLAETGGLDWNRARLTDHWTLDSRQELELRLYGSARPDHWFWGIGPDSPSDRLRFGATDLEGSLADTVSVNDWIRVTGSLGSRRMRFRTNPADYPYSSLGHALATGRLAALPPGIQGYTVGYEQLDVVLDTRPTRKPPSLPDASDFMPAPGSGVRVTAHGRHDGEIDEPKPGDTLAREWITYGGSLGGYVDLTSFQRVLGLTITTEFADPLQKRWSIPFTELPELGGNDPLRGLLPLRLLGRSTLAAVVNYRWPVWGDLDGNLDLGVGNAFRPLLGGFDWDRLRLSADIGVRDVGSLDNPFELLIGFGTRTFRAGAGIDEVRVVAGTSTELF